MLPVSTSVPFWPSDTIKIINARINSVVSGFNSGVTNINQSNKKGSEKPNLKFL